jgi:hypothetical protein
MLSAAVFLATVYAIEASYMYEGYKAKKRKASSQKAEQAGK